MPCMHVLMQQGYCLCMNNFYRISTPKSTATFIGHVGLLLCRINDVSARFDIFGQAIFQVLRAVSMKFVAVWNPIHFSLLVNY
jgi:hypothetical protein